jgi:single-stranded-DNA-specific exonuclease
LERLEELALLEPHGQGNPHVQIVVRGVSLRRQPIRLGRERKHLKFRVTDGRTTLDAVWWSGADKRWPHGSFDLACVPQINEFNNRTTVQLRVLDWRPSR